MPAGLGQMSEPALHLEVWYWCPAIHWSCSQTLGLPGTGRGGSPSLPHGGPGDAPSCAVPYTIARWSPQTGTGQEIIAGVHYAFSFLGFVCLFVIVIYEILGSCLALVS